MTAYNSGLFGYPRNCPPNGGRCPSPEGCEALRARNRAEETFLIPSITDTLTQDQVDALKRCAQIVDTGFCLTEVIEGLQAIAFDGAASKETRDSAFHMSIALDSYQDRNRTPSISAS